MSAPVITGLPPVEFTPPALPAAWPYGLDVATTWIEEISGDAARRWLPAGVQFRRRLVNQPGTFGVWDADWCASPDDLDPDDVKTGPPIEDADPAPYTAVTAWAFDRLQECGNLSEFDRGQVIERARETFALSEPVAVEIEFASRMLTDAPTPASAADLVRAVGHLEQEFAATGTAGLVHARVSLLALAEHARLVVRDGPTLRTPGGYRWVFGAGYADTLGDRIIGTSPTYGWRDEIEVRESMQHTHNQFIAIAERSSVIGYENVVGAAVITP
ncbi:hypothetical protein BVC93_24395 [Mycobacterium sp. MS1601]|uniref:hypothetical protein n=1 Tax=Mycobacterium sp. MS1601 TaxID=1936029 RepID=UPI0009793DC6|nr:hypothetical protein [Mycobacterium sp. MS1601]AQA05023.1 hypothetical protein BVC93_24395 [Mycobacterium sp. MS1601]